MPTRTRQPAGAVYSQAAQFAADLEAGQSASADQLLAAWSHAYGQTRIDLDTLMAKMANARAAGETISPAWLYQQKRLKGVLDTAKVEMAAYARYASQVTLAAQDRAVRAARAHAERLTKTVVAQEGLATGFVQVNEANLRNLAGFLTTGGPLSDLLNTLPAEATEALRSSLIRGVAMGWGADKMTREATKALGIARHRAETIMRTEALRAYRYTARETYMANADALEGWVWNAHLDSRTCLACAVMDGTVHPIDAVLDGHPRCRCAMVPRTKSWADLTGDRSLPDTRPPLRSGKDWLESQRQEVQRAMMGPRRYAAWREGTISLDDMVAQPENARWGTMRRERSMVEIREGRNPNTLPSLTTPEPVRPSPAPDPEPQLAKVADLVKRLRKGDLTVKDVRQSMDAPMVNPQNRANLRLALEDYETLRNTPAPRIAPEPTLRANPAKVQTWVEMLERADVDEDFMKAVLADPATSPQNRLNIEDALALWKSKRGQPIPANIERRMAEMESTMSRNRVYQLARPKALNPDVSDLDRDAAKALQTKWAREDSERMQRQAAERVEAERIRKSLLPSPREWLKGLPLKPSPDLDDVMRRFSVDKDEARQHLARQDVGRTNPLYATERRYQVNCTHVVQAYELRRRGYDVTATKLPEQFKGNGRNWDEVYRMAGGDPYNSETATLMSTRRAGEKALLSWGEGARATVRVHWKGRGAGGHVFVAEVYKGKIVYYDPQISSLDAAGHFARARPSEVSFYRMDHLEMGADMEELIQR